MRKERGEVNQSRINASFFTPLLENIFPLYTVDYESVQEM